MSVQPKGRYSLAAYLELDRTAEERLEFWNGEVFDMSGASREHARIEMNIAIHLGSQLAERGCHLFPANLRLLVPSMPPYRYGDLSALCGEPRFEQISGVDVLTNPELIVEVLSPSREAYDRGDKFSHYQSISTFREYLLVAQHRPHVTQLVRQEDSTWNHRELGDVAASIRLVSLGCDLAMRDIHRNISFAPEPSLWGNTPPR
jgi:Uma2 family endonuclease